MSGVRKEVRPKGPPEEARQDSLPAEVPVGSDIARPLPVPVRILIAEATVTYRQQCTVNCKYVNRTQTIICQLDKYN